MLKFLFVSGGNVVRQFSTFFAQILLARSLGSFTFGELTLAFSIYFIFAGVGDFGSRFFCWKQVLAGDEDGKATRARSLVFRRSVLTALFALPVNAGIWLFADGTVALLLHLYTLAVVFNQIGFDWYFLALDRERDVFLFNTLSGGIYLAGVALLVGSPADAWVVPVLLAVSYAVPAVALVVMGKGRGRGREREAREGDGRGPAGLISGALRLAAGGYRYLPYVVLQRTYTSFVFVVAGLFYEMDALGRFRVAHLFYAFVASVSIFLGMSFFNRLYKGSKEEGGTEYVAEGLGFVFLMILPLSVAGPDVIPGVAEMLLGAEYGESSGVLSILLLGLLLPAAGNFVREASVSMGHAKVAGASYVVTIAVTTALLVAYRGGGLEFLALSLLAGELAGAVFLMALVPARLVPKRPLQLAAAAVVFTVILKASFYLVLRAGATEWRLAAGNAAAMALLYGAYILFVNRKFGLLEENLTSQK